MKRFVMNGYLWKVQYVPSDSPYLIDRTGTLTVATTDPSTLTIYLSNDLFGDFKTKVVIHELGHAIMFSYGYTSIICRMVYPQYWIEAEEAVCNFLAERGYEAFQRAYEIVGDEAIHFVPYYMNRMVS